MATVSALYKPAAGRQFAELTSWAGDAAFATTPVATDQVEGPSALTIGDDGVISGPDGTYALYHIIADSGVVESVSYEIVSEDVTAPVLSSLSASGTDPDTIDVSVTTDEANGTLYVLASGNVTETAAAVKSGAQGIQAVSGTGEQTISLTLAAGGYYVHAMHEDGSANANQSAVVSSALVTISPIVESATTTVDYVPPAGMTATTLEDPIQHNLDELWLTPAEPGEQVMTYTVDGFFDKNFNWKGPGEGIFTFFYINNDGDISEHTLTAQDLPSVVDDTPDQFSFTALTGQQPGSRAVFDEITITGIEPGVQITASITVGEYAVDAGFGYGAYTTSDTDLELGYKVRVAVDNSTSFSTETSGTFTAGGVSAEFSSTTRAAIIPVLDAPLQDLDLDELQAVSINLDDNFSGAQSYAVSGLPEGSGLSLVGRAISGTTNTADSAASPITVTVTATNTDGSIQDTFAVSVADNTPPVLSINSLTTLDTTPIVSGSALGAISLVLVVDGVTYNPVPSNGSWIQQLNELALDTYVMAINGEDAAGNPAAEKKALLRIVDEIPVSTEGLFRPLFRAS